MPYLSLAQYSDRSTRQSIRTAPGGLGPQDRRVWWVAWGFGSGGERVGQAGWVGWGGGCLRPSQAWVDSWPRKGPKTGPRSWRASHWTLMRHLLHKGHLPAALGGLNRRCVHRDRRAHPGGDVVRRLVVPARDLCGRGRVGRLEGAAHPHHRAPHAGSTGQGPLGGRR